MDPGCQSSFLNSQLLAVQAQAAPESTSLCFCWPQLPLYLSPHWLIIRVWVSLLSCLGSALVTELWFEPWDHGFQPTCLLPSSQRPVLCSSREFWAKSISWLFLKDLKLFFLLCLLQQQWFVAFLGIDFPSPFSKSVFFLLLI